MKARNLLWIAMINIFLMCLISVVMEYTALKGRFAKLQNSVSTALETAIRTSTSSEELFSQQYAYNTTSSKGYAENSLRVKSRLYDSWITGNAYVVSAFYGKYGMLPNTQSYYDSFANSSMYGMKTDEDIYEWLFGKVGSVWNTYTYAWANRRSKMWNSTKWMDNNISTDRTPTDNFKEFYDAIGKYMKTETVVKYYNSARGYSSSVEPLPSLTLMGLKLDNHWNCSGGVTNDYLSGSVHFGKASNGIADTTYYLTPYSLGVTYIPIEVLKPVFIAHLDNIVRFNSLKHGLSSGDSHSDVISFSHSDGCISTDVFDTGGNICHTVPHYMYSYFTINDGDIEYDMHSVKVKVDYFFVDFYNNSNYKIVNRIEGSTSHYDASGNIKSSLSSFSSLPARLKSKDTSSRKDGNRIVAKVSVKMKVHIPYKSSILQWFRYLTDKDSENHFDIKLWDEYNDTVDFSSDGVWFYYTTYTAITR